MLEMVSKLVGTASAVRLLRETNRSGRTFHTHIYIHIHTCYAHSAIPYIPMKWRLSMLPAAMELLPLYITYIQA